MVEKNCIDLNACWMWGKGDGGARHQTHNGSLLTLVLTRNVEIDKNGVAIFDKRIVDSSSAVKEEPLWQL